jgi:hypothetical protein
MPRYTRGGGFVVFALFLCAGAAISFLDVRPVNATAPSLAHGGRALASGASRQLDFVRMDARDVASKCVRFDLGTIGQCGANAGLMPECDRTWSRACDGHGGSKISCKGSACDSESIICEDASNLSTDCDEGFVTACGIAKGSFGCVQSTECPADCNCTKGRCEFR